MIDTIMRYITDISMGNEMVAGVITLALVGVGRNIITTYPRMIMGFIKTQLITDLTVNNAHWGNQTFYNISEFIYKMTGVGGSRHLSINTFYQSGKRCTSLSLGYGLHIFRFNGKIMWMVNSRLDSSGSDEQKEEIAIYMFGRSHTPFSELLRLSKPEQDECNNIDILSYTRGDWCEQSVTAKRGFGSLAINNDVKCQITDEIDYFVNNEHTYNKLGLNYKITMVLHGVPGTGKTSVIKAIASDYNMTICTLSLSGLSDESMVAALSSVPKQSIVVIEDFDCCSSMHSRIKDEHNESVSDVDCMVGLTLSGILNALEGVSSLSHSVIFLTTNHIEKIDSAVLRSGRVDGIIELPLVDEFTLKTYFDDLYDTNIDFPLVPMLAKDINGVVFKAKDDVSKLNKLLKSQDWENSISMDKIEN